MTAVTLLFAAFLVVIARTSTGINSTAQQSDHSFGDVADVIFGADFDTATVYLSRDPGTKISLQFDVFKDDETQPRRDGGILNRGPTIFLSGFRQQFDAAGGAGTYRIDFAVCPASMHFEGIGIRQGCGARFSTIVRYDPSPSVAPPPFALQLWGPSVNETFYRLFEGDSTVLRTSVDRSQAKLQGYKPDQLSCQSVPAEEGTEAVWLCTALRSLIDTQGNSEVFFTVGDDSQRSNTIVIQVDKGNPRVCGTHAFGESYYVDDGCSICTCEMNGEACRKVECRTSPSTCTDTDSGINLSTRGEARQGQKQFVDFCQENNYIFEHDCGTAGGVSESTHPELGGSQFRCPENTVCRDGACLPEKLPVFFYGSAQWTCQDGTASSGKGECVESPLWVQKAERFCNGRCSASGKCGVGNFAVGESCLPRKQACGNNICEPGEADDCPACIHSNPACLAACLAGTCPQDCIAEPSIKPVCGNNICEEGEADIIDPGGCGPNADPSCLGPPAQYTPGSCSRDCPKNVSVSSALSAGYEDEVRVVPVGPAIFSDVRVGSEVASAAQSLAERGVIGGYPDGTFREERPVNRAELAKFLLLAKGSPVPERANEGRFRDVLEGEWYVKFVMEAAMQGIIDGYPDGTFRPANTVNVAEFLKMTTKALGLPENYPYAYADVSPQDWLSPYAGLAERFDLFGRSNTLNPAHLLTRGEVAVALQKVLTIMK